MTELKFILLIFASIPIALFAQYTLTPNDVTMNGDTLVEYLNQTEKDIIIPNEIGGNVVTVIGKYSFMNKSLERVKIANSVKTIGDGAFTYNYLSDFTIPNNLEIIGDFAFEENNLENIIIPNSLQNIGNNAFARNDLKTLTFDENNRVFRIGNDAFAENSLTSVVFPNSLTFIGDFAFYGNALNSIVLSDSLEHIGDASFSNNNITNLELSNSVHYIGSSAFANNSSIENFILPTPENNGFSHWLDGKNNTYSSGEVVSDLKTFYKAIYSYTLTDSDVIVENGIIMSCTNIAGSEIIIPSILDGQTIIGIADGYEETGVFYKKAIASLQLPSTIKTIGDYAFSENIIASVIIPENVEHIGKHTFSNNSISNLIIPKSVLEIDSNAFYHNYINALEIPNSLITLAPLSFGFNSLTTLTFEGNCSLTSINATFVYNSIKLITIPKSIEYIGNDTFRGNRLESVIFEDSSRIKQIEKRAFWENNLSNIILPNPIAPEGYFYFYWQNNDGERIDNDNLISDFGSAYEAIFTKGFQCTFRITDGISPIDSVKIIFNDTIMITDTNGIAISNKIGPNSEIEFLVSKENSFESNSGIATVIESDVLIDIVMFPVGITYKMKTLKIYPNPTDGIIFIESEIPDNNIFEVFNLNGAVIEKKKNIASKSYLDFSSLKDGTYFIRITTDNRKEIVKLIKK